MGRKKDPISEFLSEIDKFVSDIRDATYEGFRNFLYGYVAQAIISAFANLYYNGLGIVVNILFLLYTFYGFFVEAGRVVVEFEAKRVIPFIIALFVIGLDIWLNLNIH